MPRFIGRFDFSDPAGPRFSWSLSTIEVRFVGSGIAMRLRVPPPPPLTKASDPILYSIRIDSRPPRPLAVRPGDERYVLAELLEASSAHTVTITRESEAFAGVHQLLGFDLVPGGELLGPAPEREARPKLEIVGDSITCGYGLLGASRDCPFSFATESATLAYGALTGAALGADVTTICWSGRGVYRNFDAILEPTMPLLFETVVPQDRDTDKGGARMLFDRATKPAAVVVNLGTNDLLAPGEPFNPKNFDIAYVAFLERLREVYPDAWILVAVSPMLEGAVRKTASASLERIVARRRTDGDPRIELVVFEEQGERVGCDGHPDRVMHEIMAKQLEGVLQAKLRSR